MKPRALKVLNHPSTEILQTATTSQPPAQAKNSALKLLITSFGLSSERAKKLLGL
jgi:hypothetical protein